MIAKCLSSNSAGVPLEKSYKKKNYRMFWHEMSMRKPFFSKAIGSSSKKEFLHIHFP